LLYVPLNVIKTEDCSLKRSSNPTDFVWWFFTDEWKLFRSHFVFGFYGTMFFVYEEILAKKSKAASHFRLKGDQTHLK